MPTQETLAEFIRKRVYIWSVDDIKDALRIGRITDSHLNDESTIVVLDDDGNVIRTKTPEKVRELRPEAPAEPVEEKTKPVKKAASKAKDEG